LASEPNGDLKYIEVKTTALGPETPFYLSANEVAFSTMHVDSFVIYRLFNVNEAPRFFSIKGNLATILELTPVTFRARMR
jgi:hypothetical protein